MRYLAIMFATAAVLSGFLSGYGISATAETHLLMFDAILALAAIVFAILSLKDGQR